MKNYRIGLDVAGDIQFVLDIPAKDFFEAADEWARVTGHEGELFDRKKYTYFGWNICVTKKPVLERKSNPNPFQG